MPVNSIQDFRKVVEAHSGKLGKKHVFKFGAVAISAYSTAEADQYPLSARRAKAAKAPMPDVSEVAKKLVEALKRHPNVFNVSVVDDDEVDYFQDELGRVLLESPETRIEVKLPRTKQKYQEMDCQEQFSVVTAGGFFGAYAEVDRVPAYSNIGHEFREMLKSQIELEPGLFAPVMGPCPMHTDFYLIEVEEADKNLFELLPKTIVVQDDIFIFVAKDGVQDMVDRIFRSCVTYLSRYYELALLREILIFSDIEMQARLSELASAHSEFANLSPAHFLKVNASLRESRGQLGALYEMLVDHNRQAHGYKEHRRMALEYLQRSRLLSPLGASIRSSTKLDVSIPESLLPSLQFFQQQADSKRSILTVVVASLLGAVIGAIVSGSASIGAAIAAIRASGHH